MVKKYSDRRYISRRYENSYQILLKIVKIQTTANAGDGLEIGNWEVRFKHVESVLKYGENEYSRSSRLSYAHI